MPNCAGRSPGLVPGHASRRASHFSQVVRKRQVHFLPNLIQPVPLLSLGRGGAFYRHRTGLWMPGERPPLPQGRKGRACGNQSRSRRAGDGVAVGELSRPLLPGEGGEFLVTRRATHKRAVGRGCLVGKGIVPGEGLKKAARSVRPVRPLEASILETAFLCLGRSLVAKSQRATARPF